ncbi:MAG: putative ABC exporter domain-containing protein [Christensenellales bacterium]|jgi:hypothetical protein
MSAALTYVLAARLKNNIKGLLKSPGKLTYALILIAVLVLSATTQNMDGAAHGDYRDIRELYAIALALYTIMFVLISHNGFQRGASMFSLPDVNLVFTSPISPAKVLFYGLFQQLGSSIIIGFFIFFQYGWISSIYGAGFEVLLAIFAAYAVTVFLAQLTAMAIYSFTNSNFKRLRVIKTIFYGIVIAYAAAALLFLAGDYSNLLPRALEAATSLPAMLFPVSGWAASGVYGLLTGSTLTSLLGLALCVAYTAAIVILIIKTKQDYYEDVLSAAETSFSALEAKKSGNLSEASIRGVRTGKIGIGNGEGADAFYYKHIVENRRSRVFILSGSSLIFAVCIIIYAYFTKSMGLIPIIAFSTYMQFFSVAMGRLSKELMKPYIYLVPASPYKKLVASIKESFSGFVVEAVIVFLPISFILNLPPLLTLLCIAVRISFAMLFTAVNILVQRVFGSSPMKTLIFLFYFLAFILMCAPGVIAAILLISNGFVIVSEDVTMLISLIALNIPVSLLVFYLCRNMLKYSELNSR